MTTMATRVAVGAAVQSSEATLNAVLEAHQIGTFVWTKATGKITVSVGMEQRFGLQPGALSEPGDWVSWIDPEDRQGVLEHVRDCLFDHLESFDFNFHVSVPVDGVHALEGSARLIVDANGQLISIVGILIDATDRNRHEAALFAEGEQFRLLLQTAPSALVVFDHTRIIRAFSRSAEQMFGYTADEIIGCNVELLEIIPTACGGGPCIDRNVKCRKCAEIGAKTVIRARRRDKSQIPIEFSMADMRIGDQKLFVAFCKDVSERLASQERLEEMRHELAHVSRLSVMGEMAAGFAHELNQPLAAAVYFLGAADLVLSDSANVEQGKALLKLASEQALRGGDIIRRMREFTARDRIEIEPGSVDDLIRDSVGLAFLGESRFGIEVAYDFDPDIGAVLCDRVQIGQVLTNLTRNAIEALKKSPPAGRQIIVCTKRLDFDMVQVSVADNGPGLDPVIVDHLYMPFVSTTAKDGVGAGLSICRRIVEAHGGTLAAVNGPLGGAEFRFTLSSAVDDGVEE